MKRRWSEMVVRGFAVANLAMAVFGLALLSSTSLDGLPSFLQGRGPRPWVSFTLGLIDLLCLLGLLISAYPLLRLDRRGLVLCNVVFAFEIFMLVAPGLLSEALLGSAAKGLGISIARAAGIGGLGTAPQDICGYPVAALVALNLAYGRLGVGRHITQRDRVGDGT